jgi:small subunit ribosomal protein S9
MPIKTEETGQKNNAKSQKRDFVFAVGRRKEAVARVRLYDVVRDGLMWGEYPVKKGEILVNRLPISEYFPGEKMRHLYETPLRVANALRKFAFTVVVSGGGKSGQLGALIHGISRALSLYDPKTYKSPLKKKSLLTRDARMRQRRMVGTGGKARREKQSPKR